MNKPTRDLRIILSAVLFGCILLLLAFSTFKKEAADKEIITSKTQMQTRMTASLVGRHFTSFFNYIDLIHEFIGQSIINDDAGTIRFSGGLANDIRRKVMTISSISSFYVLNGTGDVVWSYSRLHVKDGSPIISNTIHKHMDELRTFHLEYYTVDGDVKVGVSRRFDTEGDTVFICLSVLDSTFFIDSIEEVENEIDDIILVSNDFSILYYWSSGKNEKIEITAAMKEESGLIGGTRTIGSSHVRTVYQLQEYPFFLIVNMNIEKELSDRDAAAGKEMYFLVFLFVGGAIILSLLTHMQNQRARIQKGYTAQLEHTVAERTAELVRKNNDLEKAVSDRETLLKEIHHRVKNNLTLIISIIELYKMAGEPLDGKELNDLIGRVESIRIVHEKLYQSDDFKRVALKEYLEELAETIIQTFSLQNIHLHIKMDDIHVHSRIVIPLGLIVSELTTNALKYGLEANGNFTVTGTSAQNEYVLSLSNDGRKLPEGFSLDSIDSMGMEIVESLLMQIEGRIEVIAEPVTTFTILLPLDSI